jgi:hypothetical protein
MKVISAYPTAEKQDARLHSQTPTHPAILHSYLNTAGSRSSQNNDNATNTFVPFGHLLNFVWPSEAKIQQKEKYSMDFDGDNLQ